MKLRRSEKGKGNEANVVFIMWNSQKYKDCLFGFHKVIESPSALNLRHQNTRAVFLIIHILHTTICISDNHCPRRSLIRRKPGWILHS